MHKIHQATSSKVPIKLWTKYVPEVESTALRQLENVSRLPFIYKHVAVMPDVHCGIGCTVGSVIPTKQAIIPAAVGVDIGCGMCALKTSVNSKHLPDNLSKMRQYIEMAVPHGRSHHNMRNDIGSWGNNKREIPERNVRVWKKELLKGYQKICEKHPSISNSNHVTHLGTLGTGNHFIEICVDQNDDVWIMLHSGSRGVGNKIGTYFIELAKKDIKKHSNADLPDKDLAYFKEGSRFFDDYWLAVEWAQKYARINRELMMNQVVDALKATKQLPNNFSANLMAVNCHHNYVSLETHFGEDIYVTRKGAVSAKEGELGIIPGSMGAKSYIVRGLGNPESFHSCSHGAGRLMSRTEAKQRFTVQDHIHATHGVECRKDSGVIDETPMAYKSIDHVMQSQGDLVEIVYTLKQLLCVKG